MRLSQIQPELLMLLSTNQGGETVSIFYFVNFFRLHLCKMTSLSDGFSSCVFIFSGGETRTDNQVTYASIDIRQTGTFYCNGFFNQLCGEPPWRQSSTVFDLAQQLIFIFSDVWAKAQRKVILTCQLKKLQNKSTGWNNGPLRFLI